MKSKPLCRKISFTSEGYRLSGFLHMPAVDRPAVVVGSHGLLSSSDSPKQQVLAALCNSSGIAFFRFDHRGCGDSQGYFPEVTSLESRIADLRNALQFIRSRPELGNRIGLFGSSMGGATCLSIAREVAAEAVVVYAAPIRTGDIHRAPSRKNSSSETTALPDDFSLQFDVADKLTGIHHILVFHGDADQVVPFSNAQEIFEMADEPKRLVRLERGDHPMSRRDHQELFAREAAQWLAAELSI